MSKQKTAYEIEASDWSSGVLFRSVAEKPKAPAPIEDQPSKFKISAAQQKAIKKITDAWEKAAKEGKVEPEKYNQMSMACASISSTAQAMEFINTYKM